MNRPHGGCRGEPHPLCRLQTAPLRNPPKLTPSGLREGAGSVTVTDRTEVRWFSTDIAGNTEARYQPDGNGQNLRRQVVTVS